MVYTNSRLSLLILSVKENYSFTEFNLEKKDQHEKE